MNTDKIYAESIAKEYAPKETSKVVALKNLTIKQNGLQIFSLTPLASSALWCLA